MNEGFYYRTYQKGGETIEQLAYQCSRCHLHIVHFDDEMKASVWCCGERRIYQQPTTKTFLGSWFSAEPSLPRIKAAQPTLVRSLHNASDEAY